MCGIFGMIGINNIDLLKFMRSSIRHRGPDDYGYYSDPQMAFGVCRLSIVDIKGGHQPMKNQDGSLHIVFNGEIYNFKEVRHNLEQRGYRFFTSSDTEVVLRAYEEYHMDCVSHFNGMFAFAIWDSAKKQMFLARDRLGIKPLYYWNNGHYVLFASEIKAILQDPGYKREVEPTALYNYLNRLFVPGDLTIFSGIRKLPPGHTLVCTLEGNFIPCCHESRYWDIDFSQKIYMSDDEYSEGLLEQLTKSIKYMLAEDAPIGAFLSGGLDSSSIVSLASNLYSGNLETFSLGFAEASTSLVSELSSAKKTAEHFSTQHYSVLLTSKELLADLPRIVWHLDEPYSGGVPQYFVSKLASQHVKVALSGLGADELFGNYGKAQQLIVYHGFKIGELPNTDLAADLYADWEGPFTFEEKNLLCSPFFLEKVNARYAINNLFRSLNNRSNATDFFDKLTYLDMKTQLVDEYLHYTDALSMAHGLEVRVPFLDHNLVEYVASVPFNNRSQRLELKFLLKKAVDRILPVEIAQRPKAGFSLPVNIWLRKELGVLINLLLSEKRLASQGYFNVNYIRNLLTSFNSDNAFPEDDYRIWSLVMFELWHIIFIEDNSYSWEDVVVF